MNAAPLALTVLLANASQRFVIPVYQRPYSWDEEQCVQLWEDILSVGKRPDDRHFTGSVVWIQEGTMSAAGVTPLLLIDGQQRITTVVLLLIALAEYARDHKDEQLHFSYEQIVNGNFIVMPYQQGEDRYKLTLSQGDESTLRNMIDRLLDPETPVREESTRLRENLDLFKRRLDALADVNQVWDGIQRLEVVSISLAQGRDNPQLIFESMNSTGKDLSSADLIRNFVLMSLPMDEQEKLYRNHWRVIEETLGADSYDSIFDDFIRNWLTVIYAPEPLTRRDVYQAFKRHTVENGYNKNGRISELLKELERFARYYACVTQGAETDPDLKRAFDSIVHLDTSTLNPLLLSFYDDYESGAFGRDDFLSMLATTESYVFRRAVCDCASNSFNKFLPSIIARLNKVQDEGGNYREAFESYLLNEAGTNRRFPTNAEFSRELKARDSYHFKKSFYMLAKLENSFHPKDPHDFSVGTYTIEHIMPQNALAHEEWRNMLGENCEEDFEACVNNIGNLTLTVYNSELSDGLFEEKKARTSGGYDNEYMSLSASLKDADVWTRGQVEKRADWLCDIAIGVWEMPYVSDEVRKQYAFGRKQNLSSRSKKFGEFVASGIIPPGTKLVSASLSYDATAEVTAAGTIRLANGEEFNSPSHAAKRAVALQGGSGARNGWSFWKTEDGRLLDDLRRQSAATGTESVTSDVNRFRETFWDGFYDYCSADPVFMGAFGDPTERKQNMSSWASFGIGLGTCNLIAYTVSYDNVVGVYINCYTADAYRGIWEHQGEANAMAAELDGTLLWEDIDEDKKSRSVTVKRYVDFDNDDWDAMYGWMDDWLCRLKAIALKFVK
jgi:uncharacterized protein with ParB-like and HNH nuclease domain